MKKNLLHISMILLMLTYFTTGAFAQESNKTKLVYKDGDRNKGIEKIIFQNEQGTQVGEFDVQANNPFNAIISHGTFNESNSRLKKYEIPPVKLSSIVDNPQKMIHSESLVLDIDKVKSDANYVRGKDGEVKGVTHVLYMFSKERGMIGAKSIVQILNNSGVLQKEIQINTDIRTRVITNDRKYLAFNYGGIINHFDEKIFEEGFSLYDIENEIEALNIESKEGYDVGTPFLRQHLIIFDIEMDREVKYYIINPISKVYFTKTFTRSERFDLEKISTTAFEFKNGIIYNYEQSFTKNTFN